MLLQLFGALAPIAVVMAMAGVLVMVASRDRRVLDFVVIGTGLLAVFAVPLLTIFAFLGDVPATAAVCAWTIPLLCVIAERCRPHSV